MDIEDIKDASDEISSYMVTSGLSPEISMVGEKLKNATDHVHNQALHLTNSATEFAGDVRGEINDARAHFGGKIDWDKVGTNARKIGKSVGKGSAALGAAGVAAGTILTAGGLGEVGIPLGVSSGEIGAAGWALNQGLDKKAQFAF